MGPRLSLVLLAVLALVAAHASPAWACTCVTPELDERERITEWYQAVAVGTLTDWDLATEHGTLELDASWFAAGLTVDTLEFELDVSSDCGSMLEPKVGERYLFSFWEQDNDGRWRASGCTMNRTVSDAELDDVKAGIDAI